MADKERRGFLMFLNEGAADEYKRRHAALWPELQTALQSAGVASYAVYFDENNGWVFACLERLGIHDGVELRHHPVMRRWWLEMRDLLRVDDDGEPVVVDLPEMFRWH